MKRHLNAGFTLIEALLVVAISLITAVFAIPTFMNVMNSYYESATVSAVTAALNSIRMQAIMHGCSYELIFTTNTLSYQVESEVPAIGSSSGCLGSFALVTPSVGSATTPLPNAGTVHMAALTGCTSTTSLSGCTSVPALTGCAKSGTLSVADSMAGCAPQTGSTITYTFLANGTVSVSPTGTSIGVMNAIKSNLISVTGVGNVSASSLNP